MAIPEFKTLGVSSYTAKLQPSIHGRTLGPVTGNSKMVVSRFTTHAALGKNRVVCYPQGGWTGKRFKLAKSLQSGYRAESKFCELLSSLPPVWLFLTSKTPVQLHLLASTF